MSDVNLNSPDLTPRPNTGEQRPARASSSPPAEGNNREAGQSVSRRDNQSVGNVSNLNARALEQQAEDLRENLDSAVSQLNDFVQSVQRNLEFEVDDDSGRTVVRVVDQQTDEVIRQIPDELALRLAENLQQDEPLVLLNIRV